MSPYWMTRSCHVAGEVAHQLRILVVIEEYWVCLPAPIYIQPTYSSQLISSFRKSKTLFCPMRVPVTHIVHIYYVHIRQNKTLKSPVFLTLTYTGYSRGTFYNCYYQVLSIYSLFVQLIALFLYLSTMLFLHFIPCCNRNSCRDVYSVNFDLASKIINGKACIYYIWTMCDSIFLPFGLKVTGDFVYGKLDFILKKYAGFVVLKKKNLDWKSHSYFSSS